MLARKLSTSRRSVSASPPILPEAPLTRVAIVPVPLAAWLMSPMLGNTSEVPAEA